MRSCSSIYSYHRTSARCFSVSQNRYAMPSQMTIAKSTYAADATFQLKATGKEAQQLFFSPKGREVARHTKLAFSEFDVEQEKTLGRIAQKVDRLQNLGGVLFLFDLLVHIPLVQNLGSVVLFFDGQRHDFVDAFSSRPSHVREHVEKAP